MIHVVLTGGVGSRLWPLSRKSRPKQYIPLFDGKSLFQLCVERNRSLCDEILVVGNKNNTALSQQNLKDIGVEKYSEVVETEPRNTAAAIAFAALSVEKDTILLVTPSDHIVGNKQVYSEAVKTALSFAEKKYLVTFGVQPMYPETGYGYIEHQNHDVISFREKPNEETAKEMLRKGRFLWNSGMFCFRAEVFLKELKTHAPRVYENVHTAWQHRHENVLPNDLSLQIPAVSVDYAVMERSEKLKVVPVENMAWSDLGTFGSLLSYQRRQQKKESGLENLILGAHKPVFFVGCENMIFVETDDAVLILPESKSQEVKRLYEQLEKNRPDLVK